MGLGNIGATGFLLIIVIALILFGPSKLPELGRAFGKTLREFKNGAKELMDDDHTSNRKEINATQSESRRTDEAREDNRRLPE